jgi:hypothetical protein
LRGEKDETLEQLLQRSQKEGWTSEDSNYKVNYFGDNQIALIHPDDHSESVNTVDGLQREKLSATEGKLEALEKSGDFKPKLPTGIPPTKKTELKTDVPDKETDTKESVPTEPGTSGQSTSRTEGRDDNAPERTGE